MTPPGEDARGRGGSSRRRFLGAVGAATGVAVAGCTGRPAFETEPTYDLSQAEFDPEALPYDRTYPDDEGITMFRRGTRRLGYYPDETVPDAVSVNWQRPINYVGHTAAKASPRPAPDGETILIPADTGKVHAVAPTGQHRWTVQTGATILGIHGTPCIVDGIAYIGGYDGDLYAFDVDSGETIWRTRGHELNDSIAIGSSPAYWDGVLFVVTEHIEPDAGTMWAIDAETGTPLWYDDRPLGMPHPSPAIDPVHERMLIGSNDGVCYCWEFPSLEPAWTVETGGEIKGTIVTYEGSAFVGSWDTNFYRLDLEDGSEEWRFETGGIVMSNPGVDPDAGVIYVGSADGFVYALDTESGEEVWSADVNGTVLGSLSVTPETVMVGSYDTHLYAFDSATGERRWRVENNGHVTGAPVPHDGRIYYTERAAISNYWSEKETVVDAPGHAYSLVPDE